MQEGTKNILINMTVSIGKILFRSIFQMEVKRRHFAIEGAPQIVSRRKKYFGNTKKRPGFYWSMHYPELFLDSFTVGFPLN